MGNKRFCPLLKTFSSPMDPFVKSIGNQASRKGRGKRRGGKHTSDLNKFHHLASKISPYYQQMHALLGGIDENEPVKLHKTTSDADNEKVAEVKEAISQVLTIQKDLCATLRRFVELQVERSQIDKLGLKFTGSD